MMSEDVAPGSIPLEEPMRYHWSVVLENIIYSAFVLLFVVMWPAVMSDSPKTLFFTFYPYVAYLGILAAVSVMFYWRWQNTTVTFKENEVLIVRDTFFKREQRIPYNKISTVKVNRGAINRIIGTSKLIFNINSSVNSIAPEATVTFETGLADKVRHDISRKVYGSNLDAHTEDNVVPSVVTISNKDIAIHAILSRPTVGMMIGAVFLGIGVAETYMMILRGGGWTTLMAFSILMFVSSIIIPVIMQLFHYYDYKIYRIKDTIYIKCGMIRLYNTSFKVNKINAVRLRSPLFARMMGRYFLEAEVVGLGTQGGNEKEISPLLCPLKDRATIEAVMSQIIPEFAYERNPMKQPNSAGKTIYIHAALWSAVSIGALFVPYVMIMDLGLRIYGVLDAALLFYISGVTAVVSFFIHGALSRKIVEMDLGEEHFTFLSGVADRVITTVSYDRVQIAKVSNGPLTRPYGLARCTVKLLTAMGSRPVFSGFFRSEDLEKIPDTVLARIKDGRYDYREYL